MNDPTYSLEAERLKKKDQRVRSSVYYLTYQSELYYDVEGSYRGFCQGEYVLDATTAVHDLDLGAEVSCTASASAYAIEVKLPSGPYLCFDSTGTFNDEAATTKGAGATRCAP